MFALLDIWHAIKGIIVTADPVTIGIALVVILIAGLVLNGFNNILNGTVASLVGFAAIKYFDAILRSGQDPAAYLKADWEAFTKLPVLVVLSYVLVFGVLISVVHFIRSAVSR